MYEPINPAPRKPWYLRKGAYFLAGAWVVGALVGSTLAASADAGDTPTPRPTATITLPPAPAATKTVTEEVTPESCLRALTLAEQGFDLAAEALGAAGDGFTAVSEFDVAGVEAATERMTTVGDKIGAKAPEFNAAKADCRASAR